MQQIFILWATETSSGHEFIELFTSIEKLTTYLQNHPEVVKTQLTMHEVNPE